MKTLYDDLRTADAGTDAAFRRREVLRRSTFGLGAAAFGLLQSQQYAASAVTEGLSAREPHATATAQRVIFLFMTGGPGHMETFDPKPMLTKFDGQPLPESFRSEGLNLQFMKATDGKLMASPFEFHRHGQSGLEISELFPKLSEHADDLAVVRSCHHDSFIHGPA
ncbi:MAG: DUF1501 domain-containing protein, partial [Planctomyces sp.]